MKITKRSGNGERKPGYKAVREWGESFNAYITNLLYMQGHHSINNNEKRKRKSLCGKMVGRMGAEESQNVQKEEIYYTKVTYNTKSNWIK